MNLRNTWNNQTVREIQVTVYGTIVLGVLDSPEALLTVFVLLLRTEVVMQVGLQTIASLGVEGRVGVFHDLLQVSLVDACYLIRVGIVLTVGFIEVHLCKECSTCGLCRTALVCLHNRKNGVGVFKVIDDLLPALIVGIFCV